MAKASYIGAPAHFALEIACKSVRDAFAPRGEGTFGDIFIVGSATERPDFRDVDVRMMLDDASFSELFPSALLDGCAWEFDPRWTLMVTAISQWMRQQTGLPIDFQFQPMTHANKYHGGKTRHAAGLRYVLPALEAERDQIKLRLNCMVEENNVNVQRAESAESRLAIAVEGLERISRGWDGTTMGDCEEYQYAREALVKINAGKE